MSASLARVVPALPLPPAGWIRATDVVVVGTGAAGLMTAVALADAGRRVAVVTKGSNSGGGYNGTVAFTGQPAIRAATPDRD